MSIKAVQALSSNDLFGRAPAKPDVSRQTKVDATHFLRNAIATVKTAQETAPAHQKLSPRDVSKKAFMSCLMGVAKPTADATTYGRHNHPRTALGSDDGRD